MPISEQADRLNRVIEALVTRLKERYFITANVNLPNGSHLHWKKKGRDWGLFVIAQDGETSPLLSTSLQTRLDAVDVVDALITALDGADTEQTDRLRQAADRLEAKVEALAKE